MSIFFAFDDAELVRDLFGPQNANLLTLAEAGSVDLQSHGSELILRAPDEHVATLISNLLQLYELLKAGYPLSPRDICFALKILASDPNAKLYKFFQDTIFVVSAKKNYYTKDPFSKKS